MTDSTYTDAREAVRTLNRLAKRNVRQRRGERKSHFEKDREMARSLYQDPNILGFGVGPKVASGRQERSELCLVFFVRRKLPEGRLRNLVPIPEEFRFHSRGLSVRTDVQVWPGRPVAHRAVEAGASIGDLMGNSGTITLAVVDASTQKPLILGCSHVLAACGRDKVGDEVESPSDTDVPPGQNAVGNLLRFTKIDPSSLNNAVDAAVATPLGGMTFSNSLPRIGIPAGIRDLTIEGDSVINQVDVQRFGVASKLQSGTIRNLHVSTLITYSQLLGDPAVNFVELVQYDAISAEGDSGAAVVDTTQSHNVVGMHIAGTPDGSSSFFTHIQFVFDRMQVVFPP
jgi:hypothetical protein